LSDLLQPEAGRIDAVGCDHKNHQMQPFSKPLCSKGLNLQPIAQDRKTIGQILPNWCPASCLSFSAQIIKFINFRIVV
jgi:hypothetical protein